MDDKGRRGRIGGVPPFVSRKAEAHLEKISPPYDDDDIYSAFVCGYMASMTDKYLLNQMMNKAP